MSEFLETIKCVDGEVLNIEYHQKRYESVLKSLGCDEVEDIISHINPPKWGVYKCRVVYAPHAIDITYDEYKKKEVVTFKLVFDNDIRYTQKKLNRAEIDALYEKRDGCDEILIIKNLFVTDTSIANIAFYDDNLGMWITPKNPLLKGTTRERLLDEGKLVEMEIKVHELRKFTKVALLNAMIGFDVLERYEFLI